MLRRDRTAATAAFAALALLAVVAFSAAGGWRAVQPAARQVGAWLTDSPQGSVVHANGLAGVADARVAIAGSKGHPLTVVQDGGQVVVVDTVTGRVSRIDPSQLTVTQSVDYNTAGVRIVARSGLAYAIDTEHGVVQQIDLTRLSAIGAPLQLGQRLGEAGIDDQGTLWVPEPALGQVVPITHGAAGAAVPVGRPGDFLTLTIAGGTPVVTDASRATMTVLGHDGARTTVNLPAATGTATGGGWLAPPSTEGALVPVVVSGAGELVVVDTRSGVPSSVTLADAVGDDLGAPAVLGTRIYLPDDTTGQLIVYDTAAGRLLDRIPVTGHPAKLLLFVKDGMLWIDDPDGPDAVAVDASGAVHHIGKEGPHLPGDATPTPSSGNGGDSDSASAPTSTVTTAGSASGGNPSQSSASAPGPGDNLKPSTVPKPTGGPDTSTSSTSSTPSPASKPSKPSSPAGRPSSVSSPSSDQSSSTTPTSASKPTSSSSSPPPPPIKAPSSVTETPQAGSIRVTFTPPGPGVTDYTLTGLPAGVSVPPVPAGGPTYFDVSGLTCTTKPYRFGVSANYPNGSATAQATAGALPCVAPGAPQGLQFNTGTEHRIGVKWSAPASDGGASVTYEVSWGSGSPHTGLTGTSDTISGLTNFQSYLVTVAARNPAGVSQPPASGSVDLQAGPWSGHITNNSQYPVMERRQPHLSSPVMTQFPAGGNTSVSVACIGPGDTWKDPVDTSLTGSTWYRLAGSNGWVASGYVSTANGVWACT